MGSNNSVMAQRRSNVIAPEIDRMIGNMKINIIYITGSECQELTEDLIKHCLEALANKAEAAKEETMQKLEQILKNPELQPLVEELTSKYKEEIDELCDAIDQNTGEYRRLLCTDIGGSVALITAVIITVALIHKWKKKKAVTKRRQDTTKDLAECIGVLDGKDEAAKEEAMQQLEKIMKRSEVEPLVQEIKRKYKDELHKISGEFLQNKGRIILGSLVGIPLIRALVVGLVLIQYHSKNRELQDSIKDVAEVRLPRARKDEAVMEERIRSNKSVMAESGRNFSTLNIMRVIDDIEMDIICTQGTDRAIIRSNDPNVRSIIGETYHKSGSKNSLMAERESNVFAPKIRRLIGDLELNNVFITLPEYQENRKALIEHCIGCITALQDNDETAIDWHSKQLEQTLKRPELKPFVQELSRAWKPIKKLCDEFEQNKEDFKECLKHATAGFLVAMVIGLVLHHYFAKRRFQKSLKKVEKRQASEIQKCLQERGFLAALAAEDEIVIEETKLELEQLAAVHEVEQKTIYEEHKAEKEMFMGKPDKNTEKKKSKEDLERELLMMLTIQLFINGGLVFTWKKLLKDVRCPEVEIEDEAVCDTTGDEAVCDTALDEAVYEATVDEAVYATAQGPRW